MSNAPLEQRPAMARAHGRQERIEPALSLSPAKIRLRQPCPGDVEARLALGRDPGIVRMFGGDTARPLPPLTAEAVERWLERCARTRMPGSSSTRGGCSARRASMG